MKKLMLVSIAALMAVGYALFVTACQDEEILALGPKFELEDTVSLVSNVKQESALIMPPKSVPYGKTFEQWTTEWWQYVMSFDCANSPLNDATGAHTLRDQGGPVIFLAGTTGGTATRNISIDRDKSLLFPLINIINDYPCPNPDFKPSPGQSIENFLKEGAAQFIGQAKNLDVTLDGKTIGITNTSRYPTDLFYFTGNKDLANCLDPCVTGKAQAAVSDGYWMMLKKLKPGLHILHFHAEVPDYGFIVDVTYQISVN